MVIITTLTLTWILSLWFRWAGRERHLSSVMCLHWAGAKVQPCFKESLVMKSEVPSRQFFNEWRFNVCWIFNFDSLSLIFMFTLSISKGNPTPGPAVYCRGLMMNPFIHQKSHFEVHATLTSHQTSSSVSSRLFQKMKEWDRCRAPRTDSCSLTRSQIRQMVCDKRSHDISELTANHIPRAPNGLKL